MELVDTHCHLQFDNYKDVGEVIERAREAGVSKLVCVGTSLADSPKAIELASSNDNVWASVGEHPHEADKFLADPQAQDKLKKLLDESSIVAVGEVGLDFYKNYSVRENQKQALRLQIESALDRNLPFIFHVRDAWEDFWSIFDSYPGLKGVVHSFSARSRQLEQILKRELYVGLNGIMTFTTDQKQLAAAKMVPLDRLVLETDAPFLAPAPYRGQTCEPKHVRTIAEFLAELRGESLEKLAANTTQNAINLFGLKND